MAALVATAAGTAALALACSDMVLERVETEEDNGV